MEGTLFNNVAPLRNVAALVELIERVKGRGEALPGMACFYGPSGFGKSTAATYAENEFQAVRVEMRSRWTARKLTQTIVQELSLKPARTVCDMIDQISEALIRRDVPLLIDEADYLIHRNMVEIARDIYEASRAPVILIGEELLPQKLSTWERVHGRMLDWVAAQPGSAADLRQLAGIYAGGIAIAEDLQSAILRASEGSIRRISTNLDAVATLARTRGLDAVDLSHWQGEAFQPVEAPLPRDRATLAAVS